MTQKIDRHIEEKAKQLLRKGMSQRDVARKLGISKSAVGRLALTLDPAMIPEPRPESGGLDLPNPVAMKYEPYVIDEKGHWGIIGDIHLPYHDKNTIYRWVEDCKRHGVKGVLLNGDVLDCYQLSSHAKNPTKARFKEEVDGGKQLLEWIRAQFPKCRIVYKEGNHDDRLRRYIAERAPALFDLPELDLRVMLGLDDLGIEWIADKRIIQLGKLNCVHGHEYRGSGGVNPARWLFLRTTSNTLTNHFHRSSEHHEVTIERREIGTWSVGCACYLHPEYFANNSWNHGYALVDVAGDGRFSVTNKKLLRDGSVV